jgi:hypothetical protein
MVIGRIPGIGLLDHYPVFPDRLDHCSAEGVEGRAVQAAPDRQVCRAAGGNLDACWNRLRRKVRKRELPSPGCCLAQFLPAVRFGLKCWPGRGIVLGENLRRFLGRSAGFLDHIAGFDGPFFPPLFVQICDKPLRKKRSPPARWNCATVQLCNCAEGGGGGAKGTGQNLPSQRGGMRTCSFLCCVENGLHSCFFTYISIMRQSLKLSANAMGMRRL